MLNIRNLRAVYLANNIHQKLCKIWVPTPLRWNHSSKSWKFYPRHSLFYTIASLAIKLGSAALCAFGLLFRNQNSIVTSRARVVALFLQMFGLVLFTCSEYILPLFGNDLSCVTNWCYQKDLWLCQFGRNRFPLLCSVLSAGFLNTILVFGIILPTGAAYSNMDPFYLQELGNESLILPPLIRSIIFVYLIKVGLVDFRAMWFTAALNATYRIELLWILKGRLPTNANIALYRENLIANRIMAAFDLGSTRISLSALFFGILLGVSVTIVAVERNEPLLCLISVFFIISNVVILQMVFSIGCSFFTHSGDMLRRWRRQIYEVYGRRDIKEMKRVITSLRITSMTAGGVGIIDRDIKVNYSENLLGNLVDLLVTRNSLITY